MITRREMIKATIATILGVLALSITKLTMPRTWNVFTSKEFEYAMKSAVSGDTIFIHPGTYRIKPTTLTDGVEWYMRNVTLLGAR